jgi:16S rRNA (guanine527-N7)-methyltransferase
VAVDTLVRLAARSSEVGIRIPADLAEQLVVYYDLLERWNRKINLTSLTNTDDALDRLLLEPVAAAAGLQRSPRMIDLGSGGGSPAIPLALALAAPLLVMIESRSRKAAFLREAARELGLSAVVETARFEDVARRSEYANAMDLVSMRAVRADSPTLAVAGSFLKPLGVLALFGSAGAGPPADIPGLLVWSKGIPLLPHAELQLLERV